MTKKKLAAFIVPSVPLVSQQARVLRAQLAHAPGAPPIPVTQLTGGLVGDWSEADWQQCAAAGGVLVCTPEVLRRALVDAAHLDPRAFAIMVFDECHNATGQSPMVQILEDAVHSMRRQRGPCDGRHADAQCCCIGGGCIDDGCDGGCYDQSLRLLGMTASFVHGAMKNVEAKKRRMCELFGDARFILAESSSHAGGGGCGGSGGGGGGATSSQNSTTATTIESVPFAPTCMKAWRPVVSQTLGTVLAQVGPKLKDASKVLKRGEVVLSELGFSGFVFFIQEGVIRQLRAQAAKYRSMSKESGNPNAEHFKRMHRFLERDLPLLQEALRQAACRMARHRQRSAGPLVTDKLSKLLGILRREFDHDHEQEQEQVKGCPEGGTGPPLPRPRGIVFVERIAVTYPLADLINDHFGSVATALPVSGTSSMTDQDREANIDAFRRGDVSVLVSTCALEEGLDVPDCQFVVRFDEFHSVKSHVQGKGRARQEGSRVYYYENDPAAAERDARVMNLEAARKDAATDHGQQQQQRQQQPTTTTYTPPRRY